MSICFLNECIAKKEAYLVPQTSVYTKVLMRVLFFIYMKDMCCHTIRGPLLKFQSDEAGDAFEM